MSWFKRRTPKPEPKAVNVIVDNIKLEEGHACEMVAEYDDGSIWHLSARVHHNTIKDTWSVQGLDPKGHSVVIDIIEN
jgi:hypothetical protein